MWHKPCRTFHPWCPCIKTRCLVPSHGPLARYVKLLVAHMPGTFSPTTWVSDPDMHHGTCVTHVTWCMPGSLTNGILWNRSQGKCPGIPGACVIHNFTYLVRGPWWRHQMETSSTRGIRHSLMEASDAELWCFLWMKGPSNNRDAGDLRRNRAMTRTSSHPCVFWSISCYIDRDLSRAYNIYISEINVSYICYMMPACVIYICIYIYFIYWNICMMKFLWNFILEFFFKQIGSCHGTGFVVAGGTAGCRNNKLRILMIVKPEFWLLLPVLCSMSCYTGRDISKASRNYISETNVSHISYIMLTCIISLP